MQLPLRAGGEGLAAGAPDREKEKAEDNLRFSRVLESDQPQLIGQLPSL